MSGAMVNSLVTACLSALGIDVIDLGLSTTPTVEMAVAEFKAEGGIILTASHNPKQWNALKLLNEEGEFISEETGQQLLETAERGNFVYASVEELGNISYNTDFLQTHIRKILDLPYVDVQAVKDANFKVAVDAINSSGAIAVPALLEHLGVKSIELIHGQMHGDFAHNPEPLPAHLVDLSEAVNKTKSHLGISVDPDVDRLAFVTENGDMFGEEYTLVAVADYVLKLKKGGNTVSNLSSTRALNDVTLKYGGNYSASAVGEVNVVKQMKLTQAIIGGEGNGGIILPELHYGRDALVGIAIFLTHLAKSGLKMSELRNSYPNYFISKKKIDLSPEIDVDAILTKMAAKYQGENISTVDGVKIDFEKEWVHLRKSNTEPIIRVYSESSSEEKANALSSQIIKEILELT